MNKVILSDEALKQQRLEAQRPNPTLWYILPFYLVVGVVFVPLGLSLLFASHSVQVLIHTLKLS